MKNKRIIPQCVKISFQTCPSDSLLLGAMGLLQGLFPSALLLVYNPLIATLGAAAGFTTAPILLLAGYCFLLFLQKALFEFYNHYYLTYYSLLKFEKRIKRLFFQVCGKLDLGDYLDPEIVNQTQMAQNASVNIFRGYQAVVETLSAIVGIITIGGVLLVIHPALLIFILLAILPPIADQGYQIYQKRCLLYQNTQVKKEEETYWKFLSESAFIKEVRMLNCFDFLFFKWQEARNRFLSSELRAQAKMSVVSVAFGLIKLIGTIGAYGSITGLYIAGKIDLAGFSVSILTFTQITQLFRELFELAGGLSQITVMVKPFFSFCQKSMEQKEVPILSDSNQGSPQWRLENVSYQYPQGEQFALRDVTFTIPGGSFVCVVGENGSGKTTLSKLLLGLIKPTSGQMIVNGTQGKPFALADYLQEKAYIPQDFHCYCISLKDNIVFGSEISDNDIDSGLRELGLEKFVKQKHNLYGLEFGGMELSGGEKQRVAILRAMFKKANFLLCDEPTSAIDPLQEGEIYRSLIKAARGKTAIVISHRLALAKQADMIICMKGGRIVEIGTHSELLKKDGEYATLWKAQTQVY